MTPEEIVLSVFARVRASDPAVSELYAPDATLTAPGERHEGRDAIARFYEARYRAGGVHPQVEDLFVNLPLVVAVLNVATSSGEMIRVVDVFDVQDGEIQSMVACSLAR